MAKIPLILNPEAPKGEGLPVMEPRTAQFEMPQQRYQQAVDYEKHIPGLMQRGLSEQPFQARAAAQAGIGKAMTNLGGELIEITGNIYEMQRHMQRSKDVADKSRADLHMSNVVAQFNEFVEKEKVPISERGNVWQTQFEPQFQAFNETLKPSPLVAEEIQSKQKLFASKMRTSIYHDANVEQAELDKETMMSNRAQKLEAGDIEGAGEVVADMVEAQAISPGEGKKLLEQNRQYAIDFELAKTDPEVGLMEMKEIEETGTSDVFGPLNAAKVKEYKAYFQNQINDKASTAYHELEDAQKARGITSREDVVNIANGRLNREQIQGYWNGVKQDPAYDQGKMVSLRTEISQYRADQDTPDLKGWNNLYFRVKTEVPERFQGLLISDLHNEYQRVHEGKQTDRAKQMTGDAYKLLQDMGERGFLDPPGYDTQQEKLGKPEEKDAYIRKNWDAYSAKWANIQQRQDDIKAFIDKGGDKLTWTQIVDETKKMMAPQLRDNMQKQTDFNAAINQARELGIIPGRRLPVAPSPKEIEERLRHPAVPGYGTESAKPTSMSTEPNPGLASSREEIMSELDRDPKTKKLAMQMLDTEGGGVATMEALVNRTAMIRQRVPGWTLWDELNSGFYGPIKRGYAQTRNLDAGSIAQYEKEIQTVRAGSNVIQGRTDQGYPGDPNSSGPGRVSVKSNPKEIYNYWSGKRGGVHFSHADAAAFARRMMRVET